MYNDLLERKMRGQQEIYRRKLLQLPPRTMLCYAGEFADREDILLMLREASLTERQAKMLLLESEDPVELFWRNWNGKRPQRLRDLAFRMRQLTAALEDVAWGA